MSCVHPVINLVNKNECIKQGLGWGICIVGIPLSKEWHVVSQSLFSLSEPLGAWLLAKVVGKAGWGNQLLTLFVYLLAWWFLLQPPGCVSDDLPQVPPSACTLTPWVSNENSWNLLNLGALKHFEKIWTRWSTGYLRSVKLVCIHCRGHASVNPEHAAQSMNAV